MKKLLALLLVLLIPLFMMKGWWNSQLSPVSKVGEEKKVVVEKGKSVAGIANQLKTEGLIKSEFVFKLYTRQSGLTLSAGTFEISPTMSTPEIVKALSGVPNEAWVTIIEGWRIEEIAEKINEQLSINNEQFIKLAKEGYMFPDTYLFPTEIAGILLKRLNIDMGLNADATLQYALGYQQDEKSWWKRHINAEDKKIDSPFNSYRYKGLPPTPICNPSLSSLQAVAEANPKTPYLYYYHDSKGNSHYAETLEEHNQNVANNP